MRRLVLLFIFLAVLVIVPFLIWGDFFETQMSLEKLVADLEKSGSWAWAVGMGFLIIDLVLPILGTVVMSALGVVYGWFWGGVLSSIGSIVAGLLAYGLCRKWGRRAGLWIAGESGIEKGEALFSGEIGGWVVSLSRWLPVMPEVVACMAGLVRMPFRRFFLALCCGSIPLGFAFAIIGASGRDRPAMALLLSASIPPVLWLVIKLLHLAKTKKS
ncbi:VTT domain-containing protein [bacterium]|jgi:uncharacterized membrane protein YdjX (TVP38/TMEM64 family)|nr:VTT domain-containing protein [bacterium]MDC0314609.1 VTT domain-containing protein [bacterium]